MPCPPFSIAAVLVLVILSRLRAVSGSHIWSELEFSIEKAVLDRFEVPYGAHAVNYLNSSCGDAVPFPLAARVALMCEMVERIRADCTQDKETPVFLGRDCRGQTCDVSFHKGNSTCLLQVYGETVNLHDKSLTPSCGVSNDDGTLRIGEKMAVPPEGDPFFPDPEQCNCGEWLPGGMAASVRTECESGEPEIHLDLTFDREMPMDHSYTCGVIGGCPYGVYESQILCFVDYSDPSGDVRLTEDPFLARTSMTDSEFVAIRQVLKKTPGEKMVEKL
ncbi:hypothetical protein BSKO_10650 [Bryopsis sp. KO-2023]|nr:hypothetical protein BSKO_10650 [Bryopsis sp. KO-2023]